MLMESKSELLKTVIHKETGAEVEVILDETGLRNGLRVHFSGWTSQEGPIFGLRPSGLRRHVIDFKFGNYAKPCVKQILDTLTKERNLVAWALINQLKEKFEVDISPQDNSDKWVISTKLHIKITIKGVSSLHSDESIIQSASVAMVPLIAAIAELLGVEDSIPELIGDKEGGLLISTSNRRERSIRNRLLCLSINGNFCKLCGFDPTKFYGSESSQIIEVHHIEPLSEYPTSRHYNPAVDLIPLCPNCHRAIHRRIPSFTPDELLEQMRITKHEEI